MASSPKGFAFALTALAVAVVSIPAATGAGRGSAAMGKSVFRSFCKSCHGPEGRGDGPLAASLAGPPPADLGVLATTNGGTYPAERVHAVIDGRAPVEGHGGGQMPVWGHVFANVDPEGGDASIERKIDDLVAFVATLQVDGGEE